MKSPQMLIRKVLRMADDNTNTNTNTGGSGDGSTGQNSGTGDSGTMGNAGDGGTSGNGTGQNTQNSNAGGTGDSTGSSNTQQSADQGGGGNSGQGDTGNSAGFDGEYSPERARLLIDQLREENKSLKKAAPKTDKSKKKDELKEDDPATIALQKIEELTRNMDAANRRSQFKDIAIAMGVRQDAVNMAYNEVASELEVGEGGVITNLTSIIESLKTRSPFLLAPVTGGQSGHGTTSGNGNTNNGNNSMLNADEDVARKAFGMTPEQWTAAKNGIADKSTV